MTREEAIKTFEDILQLSPTLDETGCSVTEAMKVALSALRPANDPLSLEQLREMNGEPVWIVEHPDWGHWELSADAEDYIADRDQDLYGLKHDDPAGQCGLHVLGWLAYRRPPEGEEGDADRG